MLTGDDVQDIVREAIATMTPVQCFAVELVHGAETMATFGATVLQQRFERACQAYADRQNGLAG